MRNGPSFNRANRLNVMYVCNNDGTDTRVAKEVRTLSRGANVYFIGIGSGADGSKLASKCASFYRAPGAHNSVVSIVRLILQVFRARKSVRFHSAHVVDEQLLACVWLSLMGLHTVLDIFDSMFLRLNSPHNKMYILKRIIYGVSNQIIVTDQARFDLLPTFAQRKAIVVPNVPCIYQPPIEETFERPPDSLTIAYFGTLHEDRGTRFARKLITECPSAVVVCAGWPTDEPSQRLIEHDQVKWLGALPQDEAFRELRNVDYILSIYPSSNLNNLYASPNKIYDAIHTGTPLISSDNFKMVDFINRHRLGYVVPAHLIETPALLVEELKRLKGAFTFDPALARTYCWEHYEQRLIDLHLQSSAPTTNAKSPGSA